MEIPWICTSTNADMFEQHGVPVLGRRHRHHPAEARAAAESRRQERRGHRRQGPGQDRWPRQGRRRQGRQDRRGGRAYAEQILGMDIKGHTVKTVMIAQGAKIAEEYYFSILLDRANRTYLAMCSKEGGMDIETLAVERPEALAKVAVDPNRRHRRGQGPEIVEAAGFDAETGAQPCRSSEASGGLPRRGRHPRRGQPAGQDRGRRHRRPRRQGHPRRQRRLPSPRARGLRRPLQDRPAGGPGHRADLNYVKLDGNVGIIGNGAGLVMSTLDVVAYAGEEFTARDGVPSRRTSSTSAAAPTPRSWPTAWTSSSRTPGQGGLRQRLRRHHRLRRGRRRHRQGLRILARPRQGAQAARRAPRRQQRRARVGEILDEPGCRC
jgi:succinyl-CoA synthetase beta subunit